MRNVILTACLVLAGCSNQSAPVVFANSVAGAELALTQAEKAALIYTSLPRCPTAPVCSDSTIVASIGAADNKAYAAVQALKAGTGTQDAAAAAVAILLAAIPVVTAK
jgi:PBP1b-binding outer membrane lipoprotein LpoB